MSQVGSMPSVLSDEAKALVLDGTAQAVVFGWGPDEPQRPWQDGEPFPVPGRVLNNPVLAGIVVPNTDGTFTYAHDSHLFTVALPPGGMPTDKSFDLPDGVGTEFPRKPFAPIMLAPGVERQSWDPWGVLDRWSGGKVITANYEAGDAVATAVAAAQRTTPAPEPAPTFNAATAPAAAAAATRDATRQRRAR